MKRNFLIALLSIFVLAGFSGCQQDAPDPEKEDLTSIHTMIIRNDKSNLSRRLTIRNDMVRMIPNYLNEPKSDGYTKKDYTRNFTFKLRADVDAPEYGGVTFMATHVEIADKYAFVSYNTRGEHYGGAVEVFNVSVLNQPEIISQAIFPDSDINAVDYYNGKIYITGATALFYDLKFKSPAFLQVLKVNQAMQIVGVDTIIDIVSFSANSVKVRHGKIFVTSGDNGGVTIFDMDYNQLDEHTIMDARSVDANDDNFFVLSGQPGKIDVFGLSNTSLLDQYSVGGANTPWSKSELSVNNKYIFAALNEEGVAKITTEGVIKQHIPRPETPEGENDENHVTNSVSLNYNLLFMANGQSGISVGEMIPALNDSVVLLGRMVFNDMQSSNFVKAKDSVVFVASGLGGLKILAISVDEGVPDDVIPTEPCSSLMSAIAQALPEQKNAQSHSPYLFDNSNKLNIVTTEETDVYVAFVFEGAGWKNTFGYYAYPADNPPATIAELEKYVVFPNVSMVNEGGGLEPGDMVRLSTQPFPANTVIGFYLVAQGWANGQMVNGVYTHYTNIGFNPGNTQQHVLFVENGCDDLVLAFEDIRLPGGDKDFNDIILVIKDNPYQLPNTAFDVEGVVQVNVAKKP